MSITEPPVDPARAGAPVTLPAAPAPLLVAQPKSSRPSFEALGGDDEGKGEAITQKKKAEKKDEAAAESESTEA